MTTKEANAWLPSRSWWWEWLPVGIQCKWCLHHLRANAPLKAALIISLGWCCASINYIATKFSALPYVLISRSAATLLRDLATLLSVGGLHLLHQWSINQLFGWISSTTRSSSAIILLLLNTKSYALWIPEIWPSIMSNYETHGGFWIPQKFPYDIPPTIEFVMCDVNWVEGYKMRQKNYKISRLYYGVLLAKKLMMSMNRL